MTSPARRLHFYFDVVCPFSFLALGVVPRLAEAAGVELVWHPTLLGGVYKAVGSRPGGGMSAGSARARMVEWDRRRLAAWVGLPYRMHPRHPLRSVRALRLAIAARERGPAVARDLFERYHVKHEAIDDPEVLAAVAATHGVAVEAMASPAVKQALFDAVDEAVQAGMFGMPNVVVERADGRRDPFLYGFAQLDLLGRALGLPRGVPVDAGATARGPDTVRFVQAFAGPDSYLAAEALMELADRTGLAVDWVAVDPPPSPAAPASSVPARAAWMSRHRAQTAEAMGLPLASVVPGDALVVLARRVATVEPATTPLLLRVLWGEGLADDAPAFLQEHLDAAGWPAAELIEAAMQPEAAERLRTATEEQVAAGAFALPWMVAGEQAFVGSDRMFLLEAMAQGWAPPPAPGDGE